MGQTKKRAFLIKRKDISIDVINTSLTMISFEIFNPNQFIAMVNMVVITITNIKKMTAF